MIKQFADFYRFVYNQITYEVFCEVAGKPLSDSWVHEKFQLMKRDFGGFICNQTELAEKLYVHYQQVSNPNWTSKLLHEAKQAMDDLPNGLRMAENGV